MKKFIGLLLCVSMLLGMFVACKKEEGPKDDETSAVDPVATDYKIIYPSNASDSVKEAVDRLQKAAKKTVGSLKAAADSESRSSDDEAFEILIGLTNRPASTDFYKNTKADWTYTVRESGNKILLAGFSEALTIKAVDYFIEHYVNKATGEDFPQIVQYDGGFDASAVFMNNKATEYTIAYPKGSSELIIDMVDALSQKLKTKYNITVPYSYASNTLNESKKEILINVTSYDICADAKSKLAVGGYVVEVKDNKIIILATDKESYQQAFSAFMVMLTANTLNASSNICLENGALSTGYAYNSLKNLPIPSIAPIQVLTAGDGGYTAIFEKASKAFFNEYSAQLEAAGFEKYTSSEFNGAAATAKNSFATYRNDKNEIVSLGFHEYNDLMYLTHSPLNKGQVLPLASAPAYTAKTTTKLIQLGTEGLNATDPKTGEVIAESSMCYIIRLADGSFVIIDASENLPGTEERIYKVLKKNAPDPNNIVISAWIFTHAHGDHVGGFFRFSDRYARTAGITVKQFVYNFPNNSLCAGEASVQTKTLDAVKKFTNAEIVKPHTGDVLYYADVKFNVLYTQEDHLAIEDSFIGNYNNASLVLQMETADGCKVLFGADQPVSGSGAATETDPGWIGCEKALEFWYGSFIESYVVTTFHHGYGGGADSTIYYAIKAKVVLWCSDLQPLDREDILLRKQARNQYFTKDTREVTGTTSGTATHTDGTVVTYYIAADMVHELTFADGKATVREYSYSGYAASVS